MTGVVGYGVRFPLRERFRQLLNHTFAMYVPSWGQDADGGMTRTFGVAPTVTFAGRLRPATPNEMETAARLETEFSHVLYAEAIDADGAPREFPRDARIELIGRSETYRVVGVKEPSYAGFHVEVYLLREVGGDG